jgi:hypothetical protein
MGSRLNLEGRRDEGGLWLGGEGGEMRERGWLLRWRCLWGGQPNNKRWDCAVRSQGGQRPASKQMASMMMVVMMIIVMIPSSHPPDRAGR